MRLPALVLAALLLPGRACDRRTPLRPGQAGTVMRFLRALLWQFKQRSFEKRMNDHGWVFWAIRQYPDGTEKHIYRHLFR